MHKNVHRLSLVFNQYFRKNHMLSISTESASCIVESWVGLLNKFLDELGENQGYRELPSASVEVSRLKRGLAQVRGALHSLTDTPRGKQCPYSSTNL